MPRMNHCELLGYLKEDPVIYKNDDGEAYLAQAVVSVARSGRDAGDGNESLMLNSIRVITKNPAIMREMEDHVNDRGEMKKAWRKYDIVQIMGVISEAGILKTSRCPRCGNKNQVPGSLLFVNPLKGKHRASLPDEKACVHYLQENREFSNICIIAGELCRDPSRVKRGEYTPETTQYQIAVNRRYYERNDPPERRTDYPWVKVYGPRAKVDRERLRCGSQVLIDGFLQERCVQRHLFCGQKTDDKGKPLYENGKATIDEEKRNAGYCCGEMYNWGDYTTEIVPYATEYLKNFLTDEEVLEADMRSANEALKKIGLDF